ncbi:MAG: nitroreductase family protein, partial [Nitratireductor sp.]|nr:nitroreductase family protein [Nitratireductor sp.]
MRKRHTVREFATTEIPLKVIEDCIATAGTAPSGANHQPWHFVAIRDAATKSAIRKAAEEEEVAFYDGGAG